MPVKVAVVGVGYLGRHHARIYAGLEGVELVAVVDSNSEAAGKVASEYGCRAVADYRDVLGEVQALSIVTPTVTHFDIALDCIRAGKDLMLEKPITATVAEADALIREAAAGHNIVQVGHLERFNPAVREAFALSSEPVLLETVRVAPYQPRGTDVDITLDLMIHDIDIVLNLTGGRPIVKMKAGGGPVVTEKVDVAEAWLEFEGGIKAHMKASRVSGEKRRALNIYRHGLSLEVDYQGQKIHRTQLTAGGGIEMDTVDVKPVEPLMEELRHFIECVEQRKRPLVSAVEGRNALDVALQITRLIKEPVRN